MPNPRKKIPKALGAAEIRERLRDVKGWRVAETRDARALEGKRVELARELEFGEGHAGFTRAVTFMASMARDLNHIDHHPRWENEWVTVRVRLTTHDAGLRVTEKDFEVAALLDRRFTEFLRPRVRARGTRGRARRGARGRSA